MRGAPHPATSGARHSPDHPANRGDRLVTVSWVASASCRTTESSARCCYPPAPRGRCMQIILAHATATAADGAPASLHFQLPGLAVGRAAASPQHIRASSTEPMAQVVMVVMVTSGLIQWSWHIGRRWSHTGQYSITSLMDKFSLSLLKNNDSTTPLKYHE